MFSRYTNDPAVPVLWIVNTDGSDLHPLTAALVGSPLARWSTDGSHLLFTGPQQPDGNQSLWTIDADGTGLTPVVTNTGGRDEEGDWSPDGSRIVYRHFEPKTGGNSLRVMNADGSGVKTLLSDVEGGQFQSLDWGLPSTLPAETP